MADPKNIEDYNALKQRLIGEQNRRDYENENNGDSNGSSQALNVQGAHRTKENSFQGLATIVVRSDIRK